LSSSWAGSDFCKTSEYFQNRSTKPRLRWRFFRRDSFHRWPTT